jgi:hypothetical protein
LFQPFNRFAPFKSLRLAARRKRSATTNADFLPMGRSHRVLSGTITITITLHEHVVFRLRIIKT